jgi:hypothetical protein
MLFDMFFYPTSATAKSIPKHFEYPEPAFEYSPITNDQIKRAIGRTSLYKALGADSIPNCILIQCADLLAPFLGPLFRASVALKTFPVEWKDLVMVVVCKPSKPDYSNPGAYHPIALLSTIGEILSSCVVEYIVLLSEKHSILPPNHFGCRLG